MPFRIRHPRAHARGSPAHARRLPARNRRGVAVLIVLLLLSMTLALSYAAVRSQSMAIQVQRNADRRCSARQVALTGLTLGIKKMHVANWAGLNTTLSGQLGTYEKYDVKYTAGDPALTASSTDYSDLPYRVTLLATGYATDPDNPQCVATYQIRAVVRLTPRQVANEPSDWSRINKYTVFQSKQQDFSVEIPCRIEGKVRLQGKLRLARSYPDGTDPWNRYLSDLNAMRNNGLSDYRPFNGPVSCDVYGQDWKDMDGLSNRLGVSVSQLSVNPAAGDWVNVNSPATYRVYTNGPAYTIPTLPDTLENTSLGPDPATNPLGIFWRDGNLTIKNNVILRGTLFCRGDISIVGTNVQFISSDLPALYGTQTPVRLPVVTCQNFTVRPTAGGTLTGLLASFGELKVEESADTVTFPFVGRVVTEKLTVQKRQPWDWVDWWDSYNSFWWQLFNKNSVPYFPVWLGNQGRNPQPRITFKADTTAVAYHWYNQYDPIYVPHADDAWLRWEIVDWIENP